MSAKLENNIEFNIVLDRAELDKEYGVTMNDDQWTCIVNFSELAAYRLEFELPKDIIENTGVESELTENEELTGIKASAKKEFIEITTAEDYRKWIEEFSKAGGIYCCKSIPDANDIDFIDPVVISCHGLKAVSIGYTKKTGGRFYVTNQERPVVCDFM